MSLVNCHGFVKTRGLFPWLIRKLSGGQWNHTFIFLTDTLILEAKLLRGIHISHISKYYGKTCSIVRPTKTIDPQALDMLVEKHLFGVYGMFQLFGFLWMLLFKKKHNPLTDGVICSELNWLHAVEVAGDSKLPKRLPKNAATPNNLYDFFSTTSDWEILVPPAALSPSILTQANAKEEDSQ